MTVDARVAVRRKLWPKSLAAKAGVAFIAAIILLVVLWFAALFLTQRRFDNAMADARRLGYTENWEEIVGPPIPDEENAVIPLAQAGKIADMVIAMGRGARGRAPPDAQAEMTKAVLALPNDARYEAMLNEADRRPKYRSRLVFPDSLLTISKHTNADTSYMSSIAQAELMILDDIVKNGRLDEAVRRSLRHLRLVRKWISNEPWFLVQNLGVQVRGNAFRPLNEILRRGGISSSLHDEIEEELSKHDQSASDSVRALNLARGLDDDWKNDSLPSYKYFALRPLKLIDQSHQQQAFNTFINTVGERYSDVTGQFNVPHPLKGLWPKWLDARDDYGSFLEVRKYFDETTARARCLRIINAMAKKKDFNSDLDSLGLPAECLIDPMNGERLRVKQTPEGPIVYSVAGDLKDDGGMIAGYKAPYDVGWGPVRAAGKK